MWATFSESCICLYEHTQAIYTLILCLKLQLPEKVDHILQDPSERLQIICLKLLF